MTWTVPTPEPADGPLTGPDRPILEGFLTWQRSTLLNVCAGLNAEQLSRRPVSSSNLSLLGLVRHMSKVERIWFRLRAVHDPIGPMYDPALGESTDFDDIHAADAASAVQRLQDEWIECDRAVSGLSFDDTLEANDEVMSLRMAYVHMIGEYARHNGHADILREAIDGVTAR